MEVNVVAGVVVTVVVEVVAVVPVVLVVVGKEEEVLVDVSGIKKKKNYD